MNIAIIQARMASTRLSGKALMEICSNPMIYYVIKRGQKIRGIEKVVLATSTNKENDPLVTFAESLGIDVFRGDEDNVLERFYTVAKENQANNVIRLTGDNPLIDFTALSILLKKHCSENSDYSCIKGLPVGASGDIFSFNALKMSYENADGKDLCDHVDIYVMENQSKFNIVCYELTQALSSYRWTVDEQQDMDRMRNFFLSVKENVGKQTEGLDSKGLLALIQSLGFNEEMQPLQAHVSERNRYTDELAKKINRHIPICFEEIFCELAR
jgi:spore coat polysaccharide biosynthesis protein SpsF (cytidylyltransferase family)